MAKWLLLLVLPLVADGGEVWSLVRIHPDGPAEVEMVSRLGLDVIRVNEDGSADIVAGGWERDALMTYGLAHETLVMDLERLYAARCGSRSMGGFMTWSEIQTFMNGLHSSHPSITSAPTSIGSTIEGRPQLVMKISVSNDFSTDDPALPNCWYDGLIHAREGASMLNVCSFMEWLCENYGRDGFCGWQATWLLENREIWFLPCNNIDGWVYNETTSPGGGGMWRKNRRNNGGGVYGVDLNRNWSVCWGGPGSSSSPSSETYCGTGPLSEPETANIDTFWQTHPPAEMHSTHTYGNILIYPWGWTDQPTTHAAEYAEHGEIMVRWGTGEIHGPAAQILYDAAGNTRDHAYAFYGSMSWNHETGGDQAGFWPAPDEVVRLTRRNLRSYLVTAFLAGCPLDPHEPGTPVMSAVGSVGQSFTVDWSDVPGASSYVLQELTGRQIALDDTGDSGPFTLSNWVVTSSAYHSPSSCYLSTGTGSMTWTGSVAIPPDGGGRLGFWSQYSIPNGSCQGAVSVSTDGGSTWRYLQTFTRSDLTWRYNIHELDEWQGQTLKFRWETYGSSADLYVDDIRIETWTDGSFIEDIPASQHAFYGHAPGEYWFRAFAVDDSFGPGWPAAPVYALVQSTGVEGEAGPEPLVTALYPPHPSPASSQVLVPVSISASDAGSAALLVMDLAGRVVADLSSQVQVPGAGNVAWNLEGAGGTRVPDGVYLIVMKSSDGLLTRRLAVLGAGGR